MRTVVTLVLALGAIGCGGDGPSTAKTKQLDFKIGGLPVELDSDDNLIIYDIASQNAGSTAPAYVLLDHATLQFRDLTIGLPPMTKFAGLTAGTDGTLYGWTNTAVFRRSVDGTWTSDTLPTGLVPIGVLADGTMWASDVDAGNNRVWRRAPGQATWEQRWATMLSQPQSPSMLLLPRGILFSDPSAPGWKIVGADDNQPVALVTCPTDHIDQACNDLHLLAAHPARNEFYIGAISSPGNKGHMYRVPANAQFPVAFSTLTEITVPSNGRGRWHSLRLDRHGRVFVMSEDVGPTPSASDDTNPVMHLEPDSNSFEIDTDIPYQQSIFLATPSRAYLTSFQVAAGGIFSSDPVYVYDY
jgi:hypothetical protein